MISSSCTPDIYHTRADREAYGTIFQKTPAVENVDEGDVDISSPEPMNLSSLRKAGGGASFLGPGATSERGAKVLSLDKALETGVTYGREYLSEKERVFLSSLELTLARYQLAPIFSGGGDVGWASDSQRAQLQQGATDLVATNTFARTSRGGFNWLSRTGARISADFTRDFLRFTTGNRSVNASDLAVSVVQPLLQGGGATVTMEALTQEERNLLYDLRDFANFRRDFVVEIVSDYYNVLSLRDRVQNNYVAYRGFLKNVEREEGLADEGLRTQTQLGRLRQAALQAESRWIDSIRTYQTQLDQFKLTLGVPVADRLILDDAELRRLGIIDPDVTREQAVKIALVTRPDLATSADIVDDAERRIKVAKNGLLPGLDVSMDYNSLSDPGDTTPGINFDRRRWDTTLDLDLPLDRKAERNDYRASFIYLERAKRADELARDRARLEIYDAWRAIDQARMNFKVAEQQVDLANRRLEEQILLSELGRGDAQDLVDAQNDLLSAQNQRTSTVVSHNLARLRLWRDMGILYIRKDGSWASVLKAEPR
ncbi:MAG: TolC family protein [Verrucomicrobiales bacterium]|nr:TolC family protein [Verrucomicrobiales bacterium]